MRPRRAILASGSVAILAIVVAAAVALGPEEGRLWLLFCGIMAVAAGVQSVTSEPKDLAAALLCALPPVIALLAEGSPAWLIGPLGALLLLAGELNALSWEVPGKGRVGLLESRRLGRVARLAPLALAASLIVVPVARSVPLAGTAAIALGAAALAGLGHVLFGGQR